MGMRRREFVTLLSGAAVWPHAARAQQLQQVRRIGMLMLVSENDAQAHAERAAAMFGRFPGEEQGEAVKDILRTNNPSKRMADPLEIAKLAVYLASDDSAYVVGADFLIDGGVTAISGVG